MVYLIDHVSDYDDGTSERVDTKLQRQIGFCQHVRVGTVPAEKNPEGS